MGLDVLDIYYATTVRGTIGPNHVAAELDLPFVIARTPTRQMISPSRSHGTSRLPKESREILLPHNASEVTSVPNGSSGAHAWSAPSRKAVSGWMGRVTTIAQLCLREKCSVRPVNMTISLAFLAPSLIKAAVQGRLPRGVGVERLRDPPTEWSRQFEALGLNPG
jgi:hypothetical protein